MYTSDTPQEGQSTGDKNLAGSRWGQHYAPNNFVYF